MPELSPLPTWAECRAAARSVWTAEYAREAVASVRPRGVFGVFRRRGPLPLLLYVSAREGRLVWRNPDSLALLQPPGDVTQPAAGGLRLSLLRLLVRGWEGLLFAVPPALMLAGSGLAALALLRTGAPGTGTVGLLLALGAMLHVSILATCLVVIALGRLLRESVRRAPEDDRIAAELLPGHRWTLAFCHHVDDGRPALLLELAHQQLADLLHADVVELGRDRGVELGQIHLTETLICLPQAVTTQAMRDVLDIWTEQDRTFGAGAAVSVKIAAHRSARPPDRLYDRGGFIVWYLAGEAIALAVTARFVADGERAACVAACDGHPADYGLALRWLSSRLLFSDPYGLTPVTHQAWVLGLLTSLMSLMGIFIAVTATQQYLRGRRAALIAAQRRIDMPNQRTRTLIIVATDEEHQAVRDAVRESNKATPQDEFLHHQSVAHLGEISRTKIMLVQVEPGSVQPGAAAISAAALVSQLDPDFLILTGICYGLRPDLHEFGDILVCTQLRAIDHRKEAEPAGQPVPAPFRSAAEAAAALKGTPAPPGPRTVRVRGDHVTPSITLLSRLRTVARHWADGGRVHFGPLLSASTLVSSRSLRDELHRQQPEAIGGEMEGAGVYAAAAHAKVDWIVVKAICDWGFGKGDEFHEEAARNAARFIVQAAERRAYDKAPPRGSI
ncbi:hypothetical protein AB0877_17255 [Micromonospora sp. NPDC047644]|uniref:phosphorylase family protein n=1 Tax=Micromonospora sp. NPDC047644 TaxID=3157203 RepID=UPI00345711A1